MGCIAPKEGFLEGLRSLCDQNGSLLIFDEVMTGFRLAKGGAQELLGIKADIATYGCLLYTSPSPRDGLLSRMPSSA